MGHLGAGVAVVIAAYKSEDSIARAVRTALLQREVTELLVVVDGSPDATASQARALDDHSGRLRVIECPERRGPSAARNLGIARSSAPWIAILDADDYMEEGRFHRLLRCTADYDSVADDLWVVEEGDKHGSPYAMASDGGFEVPQTLTFENFVLGNIPAKPYHDLGYLKPVMSRAFLDSRRLTYDESMRLGEDYDLYARALLAGARFRLLPPLGYISVRHKDSLSHQHGIEDLRRLREADDRLLSSCRLSYAERRALKRHRQHVNQRYQWRCLIEAIKVGNSAQAASCFLSDGRTTIGLVGLLWTAFCNRVSRKERLEVDELSVQ